MKKKVLIIGSLVLVFFIVLIIIYFYFDNYITKIEPFSNKIKNQVIMKAMTEKDIVLPHIVIGKNKFGKEKRINIEWKQKEKKDNYLIYEAKPKNKKYKLKEKIDDLKISIKVEEISVENLNLSYKVLKQDTITNEILVTPCYYQTVVLEKQKVGTNEFEEKAKFDLKPENDGKLLLTYPEDWKQDYQSVWRLRIKKSLTTKEFVSNPIVILAKDSDTKVSGLQTVLYPKIGSRVQQKIIVTPTGGRKIYFQKQVGNTFQTINEITTIDGQNEVTLSFPTNWDQTRVSSYRFYLDETEKYVGYTSPTITLYRQRVYDNPSPYLKIVDYISFSGGGYDLIKGTMGLKVQMVQEKLNIMNPRAIVDDEFMEKVKSFQLQNGLSVDGIVGLNTWRAMGFSDNDWYYKGTYVTPIKTNIYSTREDHIEAMISTAKSYLGTKYMIGAAGPPGTGIDCSGLVLQALYSAGLNPLPISIVRHSKPGYEYESYYLWNYSKFKHVSYQERKRGDLIFYSNALGRVNHVGIYLGDNQVIEAYPEKVVIWPITNSIRYRIKGVARPFV